MPSRPSRLLRWLDSEREPRGCAHRRQQPVPALRSGSRSSSSVARPSRAIVVAQQRRRGIHQAALDAAGGGDELALAREALPCASCTAMATDLKGWPAKRSLKCALQPPATSKPQLAGRSGATSTPRARSQGTQAPSEPSRGQLRAAERQHDRVGLVPHGAGGRVELQRGGAAPVVRPSRSSGAACGTARRAARSRCSQARSSGAAFMSRRKDAARAADEGLDAQAMRPVAQLRSGRRRAAARAQRMRRARRSAARRRRRARHASG